MRDGAHAHRPRDHRPLSRSFYPKARGVEETIALVGLADKAGARIGTLSGGQKRRADVAVALIGDPELVFLDEPTTGFDPSARRDAWNVIQGLAGLGVTIFLTTHYMDEAQHLAGRVAILRDGIVVASGRPEELGSGETVVRFRLPAGIAPGRGRRGGRIAGVRVRQRGLVHHARAAARAGTPAGLGGARGRRPRRASTSTAPASRTSSWSSPRDDAR